MSPLARASASTSTQRSSSIVTVSVSSLIVTATIRLFVRPLLYFLGCIVSCYGNTAASVKLRARLHCDRLAVYGEVRNRGRDSRLWRQHLKGRAQTRCRAPHTAIENALLRTAGGQTRTAQSDNQVQAQTKDRGLQFACGCGVGWRCNCGEWKDCLGKLPRIAPGQRASINLASNRSHKPEIARYYLQSPRHAYLASYHPLSTPPRTLLLPAADPTPSSTP